MNPAAAGQCSPTSLLMALRGQDVMMNQTGQERPSVLRAARERTRAEGAGEIDAAAAFGIYAGNPSAARAVPVAAGANGTTSFKPAKACHLPRFSTAHSLIITAGTAGIDRPAGQPSPGRSGSITLDRGQPVR